MPICVRPGKHDTVKAHSYDGLVVPFVGSDVVPVHHDLLVSSRAESSQAAETNHHLDISFRPQNIPVIKYSHRGSRRTRSSGSFRC